MRILGVLPLLLATWAVAGPASAAELTGDTVVSSTGPASIGLDLREDATLRSDGGLDNPAIRLEGSGPLYGFVLKRVDASAPHLFGALRGPIQAFCASGACGDEAVDSGDDRMYTFTTRSSADARREALPAGRYRLYLVTEPGKRVVARLRLEGVAGRTEVAATAPGLAEVRTLTRRGDGPSDQTARLGDGGRLAAKGLLVSVTLVRTEVSAGTDIRPCFYTGEAPDDASAYGPSCPTTPGNVTAVVSPLPYIEQEFAAAITTAGTYGIGASIASASPAPRAGSYGLWLPLDDPSEPSAGTPGGPPPAGRPEPASTRPAARRLLSKVTAARQGRGCRGLRLRFVLGAAARVTVRAGGRLLVRRSFRRGSQRVRARLPRGSACRGLRLTVRAATARRRVAVRVALPDRDSPG